MIGAVLWFPGLGVQSTTRVTTGQVDSFALDATDVEPATL